MNNLEHLWTICAHKNLLLTSEDHLDLAFNRNQLLGIPVAFSNEGRVTLKYEEVEQILAIRSEPESNSERLKMRSIRLSGKIEPKSAARMDNNSGWIIIPQPPDYINFFKLKQGVKNKEPLSGKRDSNSRPQPWQGCALPAELFPPLDQLLLLFARHCQVWPGNL